MNQQDPILLAMAVLNHNDGRVFVKEAVKLGAKGGLVIPAKGLIGSALWNLLSIRQDRRDLVMLFERKSVLIPILDALGKKFKMDQPNHGVVFVLKTKFGLRRDQLIEENNWNDINSEFQLLYMTVKHGRANEVVQKLNELSSSGATIFTGKSESPIEMQQIMGMNFPAQKDIIMSSVRSEQVPDIFAGMEETFFCSQTKGMYLYSLDTHAFSQDEQHLAPATTKREMLISIVSEELEEAYIKVMKQYKMHGGTSVKGRGSVNPEVMERIFNMTVNPQKKILLTVDTHEKIREVYQAILNSKALSEKHQGVFMILPVVKAYGLYQKDEQDEIF